MSNPLTTSPHIYKKGKLLKFKLLDEGQAKPKKTYLFSSTTGSLTAVINHCNNINQILGRTYLGVSKMLSFFGLSKDLSEKFSKDPSVFNKFNNFFLERGSGSNDLKPLLEKIDSKVLKALDEIEKLKPSKEDKPVTRSEIEDFAKRLQEIQAKLVQILGD